ncbi:YjcQ family protein [Flavobacterium piscisymbiosum]|uniref:YjcQ family protein n=1 Tax=Flavobacterium piscisymbiosum TaxID=2893753 RepID=A0ABS8M7H3_9FLAO|nr:YjcQ family protein [Flavobacterium sp. F-30]MCC9061436.1 YjcQ family protein [Flavobacterium sp. F-30]
MEDNLEYKILKYLSENNNGKPIDVSNMDTDKNRLKNALSNLKKEKYIKCRVITNENIVAKIEFKGIKYLEEDSREKVKSTIIAENYIAGNNYGNQSSNNSITSNTTINPKTEVKASSLILNIWKLISENKLISGLLVVVILWAIKEIFGIDLK